MSETILVLSLGSNLWDTFDGAAPWSGRLKVR